MEPLPGHRSNQLGKNTFSPVETFCQNLENSKRCSGLEIAWPCGEAKGGGGGGHGQKHQQSEGVVSSVKEKASSPLMFSSNTESFRHQQNTWHKYIAYPLSLSSCRGPWTKTEHPLRGPGGEKNPPPYPPPLLRLRVPLPLQAVVEKAVAEGLCCGGSPLRVEGEKLVEKVSHARVLHRFGDILWRYVLEKQCQGGGGG